MLFKRMSFKNRIFRTIFRGVVGIYLLFAGVGAFAYTISGAVTGGLEESMTLSLLHYTENGSPFKEETLPVARDGSFSFLSDVPSGDQYSVAIKEQPPGQTCRVDQGSGVAGVTSENVAISCNNLGIRFQDQDFDMYYISGPVHITRASDESDISHYALYFGGCAEPASLRFLNQNICRQRKITELVPTGRDLVYQMPRTSVGWQRHRFLMLYTVDKRGRRSRDFQYVGHYVETCTEKYNITRASCGIDAVSDAIWQDKWVNRMGSEEVFPVEEIFPSSIYELVDTVKQARVEGKRVRMTGSGLSFSDVAVTQDILLRPQNLSGALPLDRGQLVNPDNPNLARVLSGTTIRDLNTYLDDNGQAFEILGGYDGQTIAGVVMTATHGSSLQYGPISDAVLSMQVVGENGRLIQIEPTNGITDPATFSGTLPEAPDVKVELIQDDAVFEAMRVSLGSMGIVYAMTLRVEPQYWLHEERTVITWDEFKAPGGFLSRVLAQSQNPSVTLEDDGNDPVYYEFQVNPYIDSPEDSRQVLLTKRWKHLHNIGEDDPLRRGQDFNNFGTVLVKNLRGFLVWLMNINSDIAVDSLNTALEIQADDSFNNVGHKVFHIGVANEIDVSAIELAFKLEDTIEAMESMFVVAEQLRDQGAVLSTPLAGRFVKAADSTIAMQSGQDTLMVEVIILNGLDGQAQAFRTLEETFMHSDFAARPHWGLDMNIMQDTSAPERLYPRWNEWLEQYRTFNKGTFDGRFTDRLGISARSR